jgi:hypothetical protein
MAKQNGNDPNQPDLSAFKNLSDSQIQSMLMSRAGTPLSADQAKSQVGIYKNNPALLAGMNIGGTYMPGLGGNSPYVQGGMSALDFANMVQGFAPQQQPQQQAPQQPQMPQLAPPQPMPTVQTTPLQPTAQYNPPQNAPNLQIPQGNAANATALFQPGAATGNPWLLPQAQAQPQQFRYGGPVVQRFQGGGQVQPTDPFTGQPLSAQDQSYANLGLYHAYPQGSTQADAINQMGSTVQAGAQYAMPLLGAAALQMPPVINLPPSGQPSSKSGVAPTPGAIIGTGVPQVPQGPWMTNPSVFAKAAMPTLGQPAGWTGSQTMPLTPATPANSAQMPQMNITPASGMPSPYGMSAQGQPVMQPFGATALQPPQMNIAPPPTPPGLNIPNVPTSVQAPPPAPSVPRDVHNSALANAGMAMYAHFGGDPNTATHADIANFHSQLQTALSTGAPPAGAAAPPIKRQSGGRVPGSGNQDTVPALLTPGEYVLPKPQAAQFMSGQPIRMAGGGTVPDDGTDQQPPREARRQMLTTDQNQTPQQATQQPQSTSNTSDSGTSQGPAGSNYNQAIQNAIQAKNAYAAADRGFSAMGTGGYSGGGGMTVGDVAGGAAMPGAGVTQSLGQAPAANAQALGASSAIGGLASGLSAAAQTYADSIKSWQMQPNQIPAAPKSYTIPQLQQQQRTE